MSRPRSTTARSPADVPDADRRSGWHRAAVPRLLAAALVCALVAACTPVRSDLALAPEPATRAWPDPPERRPVVELRFVVPEDLGTVDGTERIVFRPRREVCELVFRLWPNKPLTAVSGTRLQITGVTVQGQAVEPTTAQAGAPEGVPGTLLEVPLPSCRSRGQITAELDFTLQLGKGADERVGVATAGDVAWFGTAFPLLAWERGRGWAREPAVAVAGEMATSEAFRLRSLEVVAPSRYAVLGTGALSAVDERPDAGTTVHRFTAPAVRDVAVTVGDLEVEQFDVDGRRVHVGVPRGGAQASPRRWAAQVRRSVRAVADRLGPLPYDDLWISVLADTTSGIEFPGAIQFADVEPDEQDWLVTHEVAHQWFYGLVGNDQARDPWLDEAFATYVQLLVDGADPRIGWEDGEVGRPMSHWADSAHPDRAYVRHVYRMGAAALLAARSRAGPEAFDAALRAYLRDHAHRIADPADLAAALADLPPALEVLRRAGALPAAGG